MRKQILVVDDNIVSLKQVSALLAGHYGFSLSRSGREALKFCEQEAPDLVLLDVEMPNMDGFETLAALKAIPGMAGVPVIFLTGNIDAATEIRALESGARDFIRKPADKDILLHRVGFHLRLHDYQTNLEKTMKELERSIVVSFADLVECRDGNTGGHVLRTSRCVEIIGRRLLDKGLFSKELSGKNLELMVRGAPFHDIGKIGISDVTLLKPGALTDREYDEVKRHTEIGARILKNIYRRTPDQHYLEYAALMAEGHHERYDGNGYPHGLRGEEIPLCSRLMAVANVYDACLTDRAYRPALSRDEACAVVVQGKGTEFDPCVVDAFLEVREKLALLDESRELLPGGVYNS
ncbi:MAG: response regulator [Synergistaceae bacterium]|jgi:putative two-component system response regulator|nr:response regulator [Synergistaceae bacterium]